MPTKITAGVGRKLGLPKYRSVSATLIAGAIHVGDVRRDRQRRP